jgi:hypothetical protein
VRRVFRFVHVVHRLTYVLRCLGILSRTENSLWIWFSAFFRADPCLRLLEALEEDLRQKVQRMTVRGFASKLKSTSSIPQEVRLIILSSNNTRQTAEMSSPQTCEAGATQQPAESASRAFSSGYSTTIESVTRTGTLRHRVTTPPAASSTEDARQLMEDYIKSSTWYQTESMEPSVGDVGVPTCALLLARSGESVYRCFVDTGEDQGGKTEHCCSACGFRSRRLDRLIEHQRSKRGHRPVAFLNERPFLVLSPAERSLVDERMWEALFREVWYLKQEEEPLNYSGKSILVQWLNESEERNMLICCVPLGDGTYCAYTNNRLDRAITHIRGHLGLKPYPCEGSCGNQDWYAEKQLPHE